MELKTHRGEELDGQVSVFCQDISCQVEILPTNPAERLVVCGDGLTACCVVMVTLNVGWYLVFAVEQQQVSKGDPGEGGHLQEEGQLLEAFRRLGVDVYQSLVVQSHCVQLLNKQKYSEYIHSYSYSYSYIHSYTSHAGSQNAFIVAKTPTPVPQTHFIFIYSSVLYKQHQFYVELIHKS